MGCSATDRGCAYIYALPVDGDLSSKGYHNAVITSIDSENVSITPIHKISSGNHSISLVDYIDSFDAPVDKVSKNIDLAVKPNSAYYLAAHLTKNSDKIIDDWQPLVVKQESVLCLQ